MTPQNTPHGIGSLSTFTTITPNDTNDLIPPARALYVGTQGNISILLAGMGPGEEVIMSNVPPGLYPLQVRRILATGTSATNLLAGY